MAVQGSILGNAVQRLEDPTLLRGADKYYDDMDVPGVTHLHFVRSPYAHATIDSIDTSDAAGMDGVLGVYTAENLEIADFQGFPAFDPGFNRPVLAKGKVRFVGDIVAAVVAESREAAADAAEAVVVDYTPLPAIVDIEAAIAPDAPLLFEGVGTNMCFETAMPPDDDSDPNEGAATVVETKMVSQRLAGVPMEPNGCIAIPDGDHLEVWIPSQNPIAVRDALVGQLGLDAANVRVAAPTVGGGFGPKAGVYVEHFITIKAAQTLGRPVKWTEERSEDMVSLAHGRAMVMTAKMGLDGDGKIVGLDVDVLAEAGAYPAIGGFLPILTQMMIQGVYQIPKIRFHARSAATNTTTTAAYRGAGRPEATQLLERSIDVAADELGIDPAEIRRKNYLQPDQFPLTTLGGANYDSGEYEKALDAVLQAADYQSLLAEQAKRRESGDVKQLGIGLSSYVEVTAPIGLHVEYGAVEINPDGTATARVGTSAHGQGHLTAFAMIVSDMLGIPMSDITLVQSDTDQIPRGAGTMGSRSLQTAGSAVHVASETVLAKAKKLAAHLLEASEDDIVTGEGGLQVAGVPTSAVTWADLAAAANDDGKRPEGMEPGLSHELDFDGTDSTFPFGSHVSVVEVDTETGAVTMVRHVAVDDCGTILNPLLVTGQQHGGIAQGAAQALYEIVRYDDDGNPVTSNLMDYAIPSAAELCSFETSNTETASPRNPLGAKGIGESGTIGSTPAIHNAVVDAVSHLGVRHIDMPLTAQTVWQAIQGAKVGS
ncbi:MAG: xanthine dehydrogenase family protein molybdopterin-binding subunit [Acidimicrobiales bacterium]